MEPARRVDFDARTIEQLARLYHSRFRSALPDEADGRADRPWDELPDDLKEANRASARAIGEHLRFLGLATRPVPDGEDPRVAELPADLVERGARREHRRWMRHTHGLGYVAGPERDDAAEPRTHPDLVPWEQLDEPTREKDRARIRGLPELLAAVGFEVVETGRRELEP